jgi:hemerythrin
MSVGHEGIDADHKSLIAIINEFEASPDFAHAEAAARKLYRYTEEHFLREELLQRACGYPTGANHHLEHQGILANLKKIVQRHFLIPGKSDVAEAISATTWLMHEWIVDHVVKRDPTMAPFLHRATARDWSAVPLGQRSHCGL